MLSSRVLEMIQEDPETLRKVIFAKRRKYGDLRVVFVDEAQDLNETQYKIIRFI